MPDVFLEKFIRRARHIEVQILGDRHGHLVHLFERDCSIQRRHQKVIEIAPAPQPRPERPRRRSATPPCALGRHVSYENAGTVEFLVDTDSGRFYFIEVNPRIQVEHTVTEIITGVDLIKSQILITQGVRAQRPGDQPARPGLGPVPRVRIPVPDHDRGPREQVHPDYGKITHYRSPGGLGLRLDGGLATTGAIITPFYDSLLVKVCASGRRFVDAARRMERALREFRVRGVKTNIPFLLNVIEHPDFLEGRARPGSSTRRPSSSSSRSPRTGRPSCSRSWPKSRLTVFPGVTRDSEGARRLEPAPAAHDVTRPPPEGSRQVFNLWGPTDFVDGSTSRSRFC